MRRVSDLKRLACFFALVGVLAVSLLAQEPAFSTTSEFSLLRPWPGAGGKLLPFETYGEILGFLRDAEILESERIKEGTTGTRKLLLGKDGLRVHGVFRDVKIHKAKVRLASGVVKLNFRDDAIFECAAFELSSMLGLRLIPPTVERRIGAAKGTLQFWVEDATMEKDRAKQRKSPPNPQRWVQEVQLMHVFDNLIYNEDRHAGNILITPAWQVVLIDHTRSFRTARRLLNAEAIKYCERDLYRSLKELNKKVLLERLKPFVSAALIDALLVRRDLIVAHVDAMVEKRGAEAVFYDFKEID